MFFSLFSDSAAFFVNLFICLMKFVNQLNLKIAGVSFRVEGRTFAVFYGGFL